MLKRSTAPLAATLCSVALLALAGCGEKDEPETTGPVVPATTSTTSVDEDLTGLGDDPASDIQRIRLVIEGFLTSGEPVVCEQYLTSDLIKRAYGDLKGCEAAQSPQSAARSVEITNGRIQASTATATAIPDGGASNGDKLEVGLVAEGSSWLIDSLESNVPVGP